ncbi:MAG: hypothetical protein ACK504_04175 [Bacteroidota bacterium]
MKTIKSLSLLFFTFFTINAYSRQVKIDSWVKSSDGCIWHITGTIDISLCESLVCLNHWNITMYSPTCGTHKFAGLVYTPPTTTATFGNNNINLQATSPSFNIQQPTIQYSNAGVDYQLGSLSSIGGFSTNNAIGGFSTNNVAPLTNNISSTTAFQTPAVSIIPSMPVDNNVINLSAYSSNGNSFPNAYNMKLLDGNNNVLPLSNIDTGNWINWLKAEAAKAQGQ